MRMYHDAPCFFEIIIIINIIAFCSLQIMYIFKITTNFEMADTLRMPVTTLLSDWRNTQRNPQILCKQTDNFLPQGSAQAELKS